jgi:histidinol dehydrogenase
LRDGDSTTQLISLGQKMEIIFYPERELWPKIIERPVFTFSDIESQIIPILDAIKNEGDLALKRLTQKFDGVSLDTFLVSRKEFQEAHKTIDGELKNAIALARKNIQAFHESQHEQIQKIETTSGVLCWRKSVPIEKVGLYIPGGTAPLFSTILMLAIPAKIARCKEIILCTPPTQSGGIHSAVLYTADILGLSKVFKIGGAQAIAAFAYGTESIPKVDKIFGPGNQYVTAAKQLVNKEGVAIDLPAGPSEVAVMADDTADPKFIAADLLSQAEHGVDSQVLLVTDSESLLSKVKAAIEEQIQKLPRQKIASQSLKNSRLILMETINDAIDLINEYAPEHLILQLNQADEVAEKITSAGSVFIGELTPESAGDYASGTNHTLPTNGFASAFSGVSLDSFVKKITFQKISLEGLKKIGPAIEKMAETEGLDAHKLAVRIRLQKFKNN